MKDFTGKKIAIVGPAPVNINSNIGELIDKYDIIIKTGRAGFLNGEKDKKDFGSRCDVLYTNAPFYTDNAPVDYKTLASNGVKVMRMQFCTKDDFEIAQNHGIRIIHLTADRVRHLKKALSLKNYPLMGLIILWDVLQYRPAEVFVSGFDFFEKRHDKKKINADVSEFRTGYIAEPLKQRAEKNNYVDPHDYEENKSAFIRLVKRHKNIVIADNIKKYFEGV